MARMKDLVTAREEQARLAMRLVSCPKCGGDEEPWFWGAIVGAPAGKPYEQECCKCRHRFFYSAEDVR